MSKSMDAFFDLEDRSPTEMTPEEAREALDTYFWLQEKERPDDQQSSS